MEDRELWTDRVYLETDAQTEIHSATGEFVNAPQISLIKTKCAVSINYRSGTVNSKSFVGKVLLRI